MEKKKRTGIEIAPSRAAVADVQSVEASIRARIFTIRGVQVMLDRDLAELYGVQTSRLNEQVKRNRTRFPAAFMFQLSHEEMKNWISQIATSNLGQSIKMGLRRRPYAFTEHGIIMLASVLKSDVAVGASIKITNAFVAMRRALASMAPMLARLDSVERSSITSAPRSRTLAVATAPSRRWMRRSSRRSSRAFEPLRTGAQFSCLSCSTCSKTPNPWGGDVEVAPVAGFKSEVSTRHRGAFLR